MPSTARTRPRLVRYLRETTVSTDHVDRRAVWQRAFGAEWQQRSWSRVPNQHIELVKGDFPNQRVRVETGRRMSVTLTRLPASTNVLTRPCPPRCSPRWPCSGTRCSGWFRAQSLQRQPREQPASRSWRTRSGPDRRLHARAEGTHSSSAYSSTKRLI